MGVLVLGRKFWVFFEDVGCIILYFNFTEGLGFWGGFEIVVYLKYGGFFIRGRNVFGLVFSVGEFWCFGY